MTLVGGQGRRIPLESDIGITAVGDYRGGCGFVAFSVMNAMSRIPSLKKSITVVAGTILLLGVSEGSATAATAVADAAGTVDTAVADTGGVGAIDAATRLAAGEKGTSYFPEELVAELGYMPGTQNGHATNPTGDCSSPVTLPESFEPACMTHDLGYDLLRVADRTGETIPENTRRDLDRRMASQMRESCNSLGCRAMASAAHIGVGANTIRQGNGAPVSEGWPSW